jgi:hypothetical protein
VVGFLGVGGKLMQRWEKEVFSGACDWVLEWGQIGAWGGFEKTKPDHSLPSFSRFLSGFDSLNLFFEVADIFAIVEDTELLVFTLGKRLGNFMGNRTGLFRISYSFNLRNASSRSQPSRSCAWECAGWLAGR